MANRRAGALRWGEEEKHLIRQYIQAGNIDFTRMGDVAYLRTLMDREAVWSRHPPRNFYQNIRRAVDVHQADELLNNGRRNNNNDNNNAGANNPGDDGGALGDDDDDDDDG